MFSESWALFKASWKVLKADPEMLLFPIISGIISILLFVSLVIAPLMPTAFSGKPIENNPILIIGFFAFYFVSSFIVIFFNVALMNSAKIRLEGKNPTLGDGINGAMKRLGAIIAWSIVSATIGLILKTLEGKSKDNFIGRIILAGIGFAWSIITMFVLPVIAFENLGPIASIKKSYQLIKSKWGEAVVGRIGFGLISLALFVLGFLIMMGFIFLSVVFQNGVLALVGVALFILLAIIISIFVSAMNGVYTTALYLYANNNSNLQFFDKKILEKSFIKKNF